MRAMILAAGLGKRMRPLTDATPKPLLKVGEKSLIEHQISKMAAAGIEHIVINHFYLGGMIEEHLGNGSRYGVSLQYSREPIRLDTAGGIIKSLPKLKDDSFIVCNADIWTDYPFDCLKDRAEEMDGVNQLAHLVMIENAEHNPKGDFYLSSEGKLHEQAKDGDEKSTFSGISILHRKLFRDFPIQPRSLVPLLSDAMKEGQVTGEIYQGIWIDVGTPERLKAVNDLHQQDLASARESDGTDKESDPTREPEAA